jgi:NAD(P)-dependent dehydrogenase (short-subunit alcohol dehydrogenase family)
LGNPPGSPRPGMVTDAHRGHSARVGSHRRWMEAHHAMVKDQFSRQDPTDQYPGSVSQGETVEHPGRTEDLDQQPDHGEHSYRGSGRLTGRHAVITGGDSGIGRAVAIAFAREGADVLITYLAAEQSDAEQTAHWIEQAGRRAVTVAADVREEADCARIIDRAVTEFGQIDILVSNAAYQMSQDGGLADISTEQFDRVLKTNVYALFWLCKAALPHLPAGSSIITTSSIQAFQPSSHLLDYALSKGAIVNFTKGLAADLVDRGIRVNSVAPGPVWTPLIPATMPADKVATFGEQSPTGRAAQPAELAPTYVFLASQESSYITAEVIAVTGGSPIS